MELEELHVLQRQAGLERQRHAVSGDGVSIRGEPEHPPRAAGGDDERLTLKGQQLAGGHVNRRQTGEPAVRGLDRGDERLVVPAEIVVLQQGVIQSLHLEEAGLVRRVDRPVEGVPAERPLGDPAIGTPGPRDAPLVQQLDLGRHHLHETKDRVLVGQEVGALDRIPRVQLQGVPLLRPKHGGGAAFGGHGVGTHQLHFGDQADVQPSLSDDGRLQRGPKPGQARTQDQQIMTNGSSHRAPSLLRFSRILSGTAMASQGLPVSARRKNRCAPEGERL